LVVRAGEGINQIPHDEKSHVISSMQQASQATRGLPGFWEGAWSPGGGQVSSRDTEIYEPGDDPPPVHVPLPASHPWLAAQQEHAPPGEQQTNESA
jgi:hypothetical protein